MSLYKEFVSVFILIITGSIGLHTHQFSLQRLVLKKIYVSEKLNLRVIGFFINRWPTINPCSKWEINIQIFPTKCNLDSPNSHLNRYNLLHKSALILNVSFLHMISDKRVNIKKIKWFLPNEYMTTPSIKSKFITAYEVQNFPTGLFAKYHPNGEKKQLKNERKGAPPR